MFEIGKTKPERKIIGSITKNTDVIIACCCVRDMVDTNNPSPSVVNKKIKLKQSKRSMLPFIGIPK